MLGLKARNVIRSEDAESVIGTRSCRRCRGSRAAAAALELLFDLLVVREDVVVDRAHRLQRAPEVLHLDLLGVVVVAQRLDGGLAGDALQIGADVAVGDFGDPRGGSRRVRAACPACGSEDPLAALLVGLSDHDEPVEPAGAQQRGVDHVGTVGGADHHHVAHLL